MLKLIGVGFGRTGTTSTKLALDILGLSPCHHMSALIDDPSLSQKWYDVTFNGYRDWDDLFAGYQATLDWPAVTYWRELADHYPHAKLLLTVRDPESWYKSMVKTVLPVMERPLAEEGAARLRRLTSRKVIRDDTFNGVGLTDPEATMRRFEQHNDEVKAAFGSDRLLVWRVQDGWAPLCDFLDLSVPDVPFPRSNSASQFTDVLGRKLG
ncbi:MAG: sulfotransferase family protein [Chloroflexota bacterium]